MYIEKEKVFERTNGGLDIIATYYPDVQKAIGNKNTKFKIREENTPSASLKLMQDGVYIVTDFGEDQTPRNAIQIVMLEEKCDFKTALKKIATQYGIEGENKQIPQVKADFQQRKATDKEIEGTRTFITKPFCNSELKTLFPAYQETHREKYLALCQRYYLFSCKQYTQIKNRKALTFQSNESFPIFFFEIKQGSTIHRKVYKPLEKEKKYRFFWDNGRPKDFIFGLEQCQKDFKKLNADNNSDLIEFAQEEEDEKLPSIFIGSGDRDSLNLAYLEKHVIWLNSETEQLTEKQYFKLMGLCKKLYNVPDLDSTGKKAGITMARKFIEIRTVWLPKELLLKTDLRGNSCKDFTDFRKHNPYAKDWNNLVKKALQMQFWDTKIVNNNKGLFSHFKYELNNVQAYYFLQMNGFYRLISKTNKEGFLFIRENENIISEIRSNDIRSFIHSFLEQKNHETQLRNAMFRTNQLNETSLANLGTKDIDFNSSDKHYQYIYFQNRTLKVTSEKIESFKGNNTDKYVWEKNVIQHDFKQEDIFKVSSKDGKYSIKTHNKEGLFFKFLYNSSRMHWKKEQYDEQKLNAIEKEEHQQHFINKIYTIGYLLHRYKDPSKAFCPFAMDNKISTEDESHGGSGKSIMFKSVQYLLQSITLDARNKKLFDNNHVFENVSEHTDCLLFDDANRYFPFDNLFSRITGDFQVNPKGTTGFTIPFEQAPKMAITTNYTPSKVDPSTERRLLYTVFSDYYHDNTAGDYQESRSPRSEFKMNLFTDFDEKQWNLFYNFMLQCLQTYLSFPKIAPPMGNVSKRNLINIMGVNFKDWADFYFEDKFNEKLLKSDVINHFYENTKLYKWSSNKFTKALKAWIKFNEYELNPESVANKKGRVVSWIDGKAVEMYYIQNEDITTTEREPF